MDAKISELIEKMSELGFSTGCSKDDVFKKLKKNEIKELCIEMESVICHLGSRIEKAKDFFTTAWKTDKAFCEKVTEQMKSEVF